MEHQSKTLLITLMIQQGNSEEKLLFLKLYIIMADIFCTGTNFSPHSKI